MSVSPRVQCPGCKKYFSSFSRHFDSCEQLDQALELKDGSLPESEVQVVSERSVKDKDN